MRFRFPLTLAAAGVALALPSAGLRAQTVTLTAFADTAITESAPENNLGQSWLAAGVDDWGQRSRALLRFFLPPEVPAGSIVSSARVVLVVTHAPQSVAGSPEFSLHRLTRRWEPGCLGTPARDDWGAPAWLCPPPPGCSYCATWMSTGLEDWFSPGGAAFFDYQPAASSRARLSGSILTFESVRQDVQAWLNGGANHGWILMATDESRWNSLRRFGSREDPPVTARLIMTYAAPPPQPPVIIAEPRDTKAPTGGNATFSVVATGTQPLTYQWYRNHLPIHSSNSDLLILQKLTKDRSGSYSVQVSNAAGSVPSANADLTVLDPPVIVTHPTGGLVLPGAPVTLFAEAIGDELSQQWHRNGQPVVGATDSTLAIDSFQTTDAGTYVFRVTSPVGVAQSNPAVLTLVLAPVIQRMRFEEGGVYFDFAVQAGVPCVVEYANSLRPLVWERLIRVSSPHSPMIFPVHDQPAGNRRYYRVRTD